MSAPTTIGGVLRIIADIPLPERDRPEVCAFVAKLPRNQNEPAQDWQVAEAMRLASKSSA